MKDLLIKARPEARRKIHDEMLQKELTENEPIKVEISLIEEIEDKIVEMY